MKRYYRVAEHTFMVEMPADDPLWDRMGQYSPFEADPVQDLLFCLSVADFPVPEGYTPVFKDKPQEGQPPIEILQGPDGWMIKSVCTVVASADWKSARMSCAHPDRLYCLNNALMILYAFCSAPLGTLEMHASVISCQGRGFLFLAPSGTGKSTHSQMWLRAVPGSELLNDDNPIIRVLPGGEVRVYGSPWSGKTPCYRNLSVPAGGFVRIQRAPYNRCSHCGRIEAYAMLYSSCSGFKANRQMSDAIHESINAIAFGLPCYTMECLPDEAAAIECSSKVL